MIVSWLQNNQDSVRVFGFTENRLAKDTRRWEVQNRGRDECDPGKPVSNQKNCGAMITGPRDHIRWRMNWRGAGIGTDQNRPLYAGKMK